MIRFAFSSILRALRHLVLAGLLCPGAQLPAQAGVLATATFEGRTYHLLDTDGTKWWDAAQAEAIALGGHLVTVNSAAENQFLIDTFSAPAIQFAQANNLPDKDRISFWIGLSDAAVELNYIWATGDPVSYTNWALGQPQNGVPDEDYGGMFVNFGPVGQWHDIVSDTRNPDLPFAIVETANPRAPILTVIHQDRAYHLLQTAGRDWWVKAQAQAARYGGEMLTISSEEENRWVLETFGPAAVNWAATQALPNQGRISIWLGLSDYVAEGSYQWKSGAPLTYTHWDTGQPQSTTFDEDFIAMAINFGQPGHWHDLVDDPRRGDLPFNVVVTPAPFVHMQVVGTQTVLLWRPPAGWQLQRSTDLAIGSWLPVSGTPAPGGRFETSLPSTGREFFRLLFTGLTP